MEREVDRVGPLRRVERRLHLAEVDGGVNDAATRRGMGEVGLDVAGTPSMRAGASRGACHRGRSHGAGRPALRARRRRARAPRGRCGRAASDRRRSRAPRGTPSSEPSSIDRARSPRGRGSSASGCRPGREARRDRRGPRRAKRPHARRGRSVLRRGRRPPRRACWPSKSTARSSAARRSSPDASRVPASFTDPRPATPPPPPAARARELPSVDLEGQRGGADRHVRQVRVDGDRATLGQTDHRPRDEGIDLVADPRALGGDGDEPGREPPEQAREVDVALRMADDRIPVSGSSIDASAVAAPSPASV